MKYKIPCTIALILAFSYGSKEFSQAAKAKSFKEIEESVSTDSGAVESMKFRTVPVAFTTRKIPKGHIFTAADLEDHNIKYRNAPPDAIISCQKLYGRKCVVPLKATSVVSVQDIGIPLMMNQIVSAKARDWENSTEELGPICITETPLKAGEQIKKENVTNSRMPLRLMPCNAVPDTSQAIGKKCKFRCEQKHILMRHNLF